jgi:hypothetical protein
MRLLVVLMTLFAATSANATNYALVIGVENYERADVAQSVVQLNYAAEDAEALRNLLSKEQFQVTLLTHREARAEYILREFKRFRDIIEKEDSFLLFFAGHGVRDPSNEQTYWLTFDTDLGNLDHNGIRLTNLLDQVRELKAGRKLVLLDHCFSGDVISPDTAAAGVGVVSRAGTAASNQVIATAERRGVFPAVGIATQLTEAAKARGLVIVGAARYESFESSTIGHGVFTEALIRAFETSRADKGEPFDSQLSISELIDFIRSEVKAIAAELNLSQEVIDVAEDASNFSQWIVARLPPPPVDVSSYLATIEAWGDRPRNWIEPGTILICARVLEEWEQALANGTTLDAVYLTIKDKIVAHVKLVDTPGFTGEDMHRTIAQGLEREVRRLWLPAPGGARPGDPGP